MGSEEHHHESPFAAGLHKVEHVLHNVDIAEAPIPHTYDAALDPKNQHTHPDRVHGGAGHGDRHTVFARANLPPRVDPADLPNHHHEAANYPQHQAPLPPQVIPEPQGLAEPQRVVEPQAPVDMPPPPRVSASPPTDEKPSEHYAGSSEKHGASTERQHSVENPDLESATSSSEQQGEQQEGLPMLKLKRFMRRHRWVAVLILGLFFTSWWISIIAQDKTRHRWLIPTFLWLFLMIRFITFYVPTRPLLIWANWVWQRTFVPVRDRIPEKFWVPIEALCLAITVLVATFATPENDESQRKDRAVSFFGYVVFYFGFFVVSRHKRRIRWHTVVWGMFLQFVIALFVLRTKAGFDFFSWISFLARKLLSFSGDGAAFLTSRDFVEKGWFIVTTLCSIMFFIAFIHIWFYFGVLQWLVGKFAQGFYWLMQISGAEAVVVAATPFVGQGESAVLIKPFLPHCTEAEIFQIMTSGFATVSGSVLASYVHMGVNPATLVTSCVMSIPASVAAAKLVLPETEDTLSGESSVVPDDSADEAHNVIHAFSNGAMMGMQIALSMFANLLCIIALVSLIDALLTWFGKFWGIPHLTLEQIMGYIFYPVAFLMGVSRNGDLYKVGKLLGIKLVQNEFVAYNALFHQEEYSHLSLRSQIIATYALCGFSNIGTCGIQLGVLAGMAPTRKGTVASLLVLALFVGCACTFSSACVAGMLMTNLKEFDGVSMTDV